MISSGLISSWRIIHHGKVPNPQHTVIHDLNRTEGSLELYSLGSKYLSAVQKDNVLTTIIIRLN